MVWDHACAWLALQWGSSLLNVKEEKVELHLLPFPLQLALAAVGQGLSSLPAKQHGKQNATGSAVETVGWVARWALLLLGAAWSDCSLQECTHCCREGEKLFKPQSAQWTCKSMVGEAWK